MHDNLRNGTGNIDAFARVFVIVASAILERGVARWNLLDAADEALQGRAQRLLRKFNAMPLEDSSFGIAGRGRLAKADGRGVGLFRIQKHVRKFGCMAEAQRKKARGQRVERSRMPCFFRTVETLRLLQHGVRRETPRLVEQQHTIDPPPLHSRVRAFLLHGIYLSVRKDACGLRLWRRRWGSTGAAL